jgi:hypothetical protein
MIDVGFGFTLKGNCSRAVSLALLATLASVGLPACSDDSSAPGATGGTGGTSGQGGTAGNTTGGVVSTGGNGGASGGKPPVEDLGIRLLDRPARQTYDCTISRPVSLLNERWLWAELLSENDEPKVLWASQPESLATTPTTTLGLSGLSTGGVLAAPKPITESLPGWIVGVETTKNGGQTLATWFYQDASDRQSYQFAIFDGDGTLALPPVALPSISNTESFGTLQLPHIAAKADGSLLLYGNHSQGSETARVVSLTAQGEIEGTPETLVTGARVSPLRLLSIPNGYLAFYWVNGASENGLYLRRLDGRGVPQGEPVRISEGALDPRFFLRGEQVWAAWTEEEGDSLSEQSAMTLRIARFDTNGARVAPDARVQMPVANQAARYPHFIDLGDDVGLFWSKESIIYICAGCHSDAHLEFIVLDGVDLTPKSQMLSLPNLQTVGGLTEARAQRFGDEIVLVSTVQYHTWAEGASASVRCVKQ